MTAMCWTLLVGALLAAESPQEPSRKPNPFAPSLRLLTEEEERQLDQVIDRFIQYDIGRLRGAEGKQALTDFQRLNADAIPALIRGINRAAKIEASCPAVTIGQKLATLLRVSNDPELLEFARENIGAGVTQSRHMGVLRDLRVLCTMRKSAVARNPMPVRTPPATSELRALSLTEVLNEAARLERGPRRDELLRQLDLQRSEDVLGLLGPAAGDGSDPKAQQRARDLLDQYLARQSAKTIGAQLRHELPEVRAAAARAAGQKGLRVEKELVELLADADADVRQAARQALVRLNPRVDFGPERDADEAARTEAVKRWRDWLAKQGGR